MQHYWFASRTRISTWLWKAAYKLKAVSNTTNDLGFLAQCSRCFDLRSPKKVTRGKWGPTNLCFRDLFIIVVCFCPYLDLWTCGNCSQAHFKMFIFDILRSQHFWEMQTSRLYIYIYIYIYCQKWPFLDCFRVSRYCLCRSCLHRFGDLRKNTPWIFGSRILWI